jgi:hypothetical protein
MRMKGDRAILSPIEQSDGHYYDLERHRMNTSTLNDRRTDGGPTEDERRTNQRWGDIYQFKQGRISIVLYRQS